MSNKIMSNTYKIIIAAIAVTVLGATSIFLVGRNREQNVVSTQSSSSVSSIKSQIVSNSSFSQSQVAFSSSIVTQTSLSVKAESQVAISNTTKCNLPYSENLVKTDNGCFEIEYIFADVSIFKNSSLPDEINKNKFFDTYENRNLVKLISTDYYNKIRSKFVSPIHKIATVDSKKLSDNEFSLSLIISDQEYNKKNNLIGYVPVCQYNYNIKLSPKLEFSTNSTNKDSYCSQTQSSCNQLDSADLVRSDSGCFELLTYGAIYKNPSFDEKQNANLLFKNDQNLKLVNEITKNYYSKIKDKIISKNNKIAIFGSKKVSNNAFFLSLAIIVLSTLNKTQQNKKGSTVNATMQFIQLLNNKTKLGLTNFKNSLKTLTAI